ncbi:MAG: hypothetical protein AAGM38_06745 [Pseudomonadota bacterium]
MFALLRPYFLHNNYSAHFSLIYWMIAAYSTAAEKQRKKERSIKMRYHESLARSVATGQAPGVGALTRAASDAPQGPDAMDRSAYAAAFRMAMRRREANDALRHKERRLPIPVHNM